MKIGYPCMNRSIGCSSAHTFRLKSYSSERLVETVQSNLACLDRILRFNVERDLLFFRITSDLVPFASHPVCQFDWQRHFAAELASIGTCIRAHDMRISMHPDQFVLINAVDKDIYLKSVAELEYHADVLDAMGLDQSAKLQIHVGGVYGDRAASLQRFVDRYRSLPSCIQRRLVIENDDRRYSLADCLWVHERVGTPVLFDSFHHECRNHGEPMARGLAMAAATWTSADGLPMVDYSSQDPDKRTGAHTQSIDMEDFAAFCVSSRSVDFDLMLEIKDKEASALAALESLWDDSRLVKKVEHNAHR